MKLIRAFPCFVEKLKKSVMLNCANFVRGTFSRSCFTSSGAGTSFFFFCSPSTASAFIQFPGNVCAHLVIHSHPTHSSPVLVTIVALFSFAKLEGKDLTPPIAFTSIAIFYELRFALNILPESFMELLQALIR